MANPLVDSGLPLFFQISNPDYVEVVKLLEVGTQLVDQQRQQSYYAPT